MSAADQPGWDGVGDDLADALVRLRRGDAILLAAGAVFVQFIWFVHGHAPAGPAVFVHTTDGEPGSPAEAGLAALGWARRDEEPTVAQPEVPAPLDAAAATRLADLIVRTLRDVHGVADPAAMTYTSFNDNGLRAPRLRTVAAGPKQQAQDDPDPATLLPAPAPSWQRWCTLLADGLDDWSHAAFDRLVAAHGWQASTGLRRPAYATGDGEWVTAGTGEAGRHGHGEISSVTVSRPVDAADVATQFRQALAAAVTVLGHPPLVGDEDRRPFARWRGARTTVTVSAVVGGAVRLLVEPTEARENVIYNSQKWMMTPDEWSPDELWMTEPDLEAPQAKTLSGMMTYPHPPATTIDDVLDELRALFTSWCEALPLLYPYATGARWRLRFPAGDMIAEGRFTRERVTARFGWKDEYGEPAVAAPGPGVAADLAGRVRDALTRAGVTGIEQVRGAAWSDTPAERLFANRLTLAPG